MTKHKSHADWTRYTWADGVVQWRYQPYYEDKLDENNTRAYYIERVRIPSKNMQVRRKWHIVERIGISNGVYGKKAAGPFPSFKAVRAAFRLLTNL